RYSLSEQTKQILKSLDKEINIIAFFTESNRSIPLVKHYLDLYAHATKNITVSLKDPDVESNLADKYGIERDGYTAFDDGERHEITSIVSEQAFTSTLLRVIKNETKRVYFLTGHEERSIDDFSRRGYQQVKTELQKINYEVLSLSLLKEQQIPADCDALVVAGPTKPLRKDEIETIERYLNENGKLLLLLDPSHNSPNDVNDGLVQLMKKWGVKVGNDLVHDRVNFFLLLGGSTALDLQFEPHEITRNFMQLQIPFIYCRSVTPMPDLPDDISVKTLAKTMGPKGVSWAETERQTDGTFSDNGYTPNVDISAHVSVAVAVEEVMRRSTEEKEAATPTRIVVFGDSDFASDVFLATDDPNVPAYPPIFNAIVNWLTLEDDLVTITENDPSKRTLRRLNDYQARLVQILSVFLIPLTVFITGIVVWWVRREGGTG
ncbi:hypothetical protein F4001_11540, partial [Candidatus Poribacteria bacterium]|nr:hypothetical protein [Candidatus Poribacteria bacterium]